MQALLSICFIINIWYLICGISEKISYLSDKKVKKKNHIPVYYTSSFKGSMGKIHKQSINKKSLYPVKELRRKTKRS